MTIRASAVNGRVLTWARERAGLSLVQVAARVKRDPDTISAWEAGTQFPTYHQLEILAESLYHRPVALFFLPEPPDEPPPQRQFRTLPDFEVEALSADTRLALRQATAYQESLRELTGGINPVPKQILKDLRAAPDANVEELALRVRDYLGVSLATQVAWHDAREGMAEWRTAVEQAGIFVFKRSLKQREISGFCLSDDTFPLIFINNSTPFTRQTFTLLHELAHLLFGVSSITKLDPKFADEFIGATRTVEVACNRLAAEVLLPRTAVDWSKLEIDNLDPSVTRVADRFNVSREVVLRRLLDLARVERHVYLQRAKAWTATEQEKDDEGGGNYYATQGAYLSRSFMDLAFGRYRAGLLSLPELAEHLGVKARNLGKLEDHYMRNS